MSYLFHRYADTKMKSFCLKLSLVQQSGLDNVHGTIANVRTSTVMKYATSNIAHAQ